MVSCFVETVEAGGVYVLRVVLEVRVAAKSGNRKVAREISR